MVNRKGQLKIQQMTFMLLGVTLFFILAGLFALSLFMGGLNQSATDLAKEDAMSLIAKLANSPEFSCGKAFSHGEATCVDFDKIMALGSKIENYDGFWRVSGIRVERLSNSGELRPCQISNYPNCDVIDVYSETLRPGNTESETATFVSLCRKESLDGEVYDACEVAKLYVKSEEQRE